MPENSPVRRDQIADERDAIADERDRIADERDEAADRRDELADERDRTWFEQATAPKDEETRIRRLAEGQAFFLRKRSPRDPTAADLGTYDIVERRSNAYATALDGQEF